MRSLVLTTLIILLVFTIKCMDARRNFVKEITEGRMQNISGAPMVDLGGQNYYFDFTSTAINWLDAQELCRQMDLVGLSIETQEEHDLISEYLRNSLNNQKNFWSSGSDWAIDGEWNWAAKGVPISYNGWAPGTPAAEKRCLWLTDSVDYQFSDFMCETRGIGFICEEFFKSSNKTVL